MLLGILAVTTGCQDSLRFRLNADVQVPARSVIVFFPDGMDLTCFNAMVAAGELPNIRRVFVDGGVQVHNAVTGLPSITQPNCTSTLTGVYPGHHGIMGNFWFDRDRLLTRYYVSFETYRTASEHFIAPTLYEILYDHFTVNIQHHTRRGVTETIDNNPQFVMAWLLSRWLYADDYAGLSFREIPPLANRSKRWPSVVMTYYPAVDEVGHRYGSDSSQYGEALRGIDSTVGRITTAVEQAGLADRTYYVLITDHSHVPTHQHHSDLRRFIRKDRGLRLRSDPLTAIDYLGRLKELEKYDVVGGVDEDRAVMFHLRGKAGWQQRPDDAEVEDWVKAPPALTDVPGVRFAVVRAGPDRAHVLARDGSAFVERRVNDGRREYRLVAERGDPLQYRDHPDLAAFAAAGWHGSREWLAATVDAEDPDFVAQVVEMLDSPHTGDVVLFASNGWSFDPVQQGGHGSCTAHDMKIPLFFAGADLPKGATIGPGRNVDVTPTIIGLLGEHERLSKYALDGIDLSLELKRAKPRG